VTACLSHCSRGRRHCCCSCVLEREEGTQLVQKFAGAAARCRSGGAGQVARSPAASWVRHVVVCARQRHQRPALPLLSGPTASIFPTNLPPIVKVDISDIAIISVIPDMVKAIISGITNTRILLKKLIVLPNKQILGIGHKPYTHRLVSGEAIEVPCRHR
jgi:hypothetical protein